MSMRPLVLLPLLLLTACADSSSDVLPPAAADALVVDYDAADGTPAESWTLSCTGSVSGTHPEAQAACEHLRPLQDPFAPLPAEQMCTEQYGGPQTARVSGTWAGDPVDLTLARSDGCHISQWEGLVPLVPVTEGAF